MVAGQVHTGFHMFVRHGPEVLGRNAFIKTGGHEIAHHGDEAGIVLAKWTRLVIQTQPPVCSPGAKWDARRSEPSKKSGSY